MLIANCFMIKVQIKIVLFSFFNFLTNYMDSRNECIETELIISAIEN